MVFYNIFLGKYKSLPELKEFSSIIDKGKKEVEVKKKIVKAKTNGKKVLLKKKRLLPLK